MGSELVYNARKSSSWKHLMKPLLELVERLGSLLCSEVRKNGAAVGLEPMHIQVLFYLSRCNRFSNTPSAIAQYMDGTDDAINQTILLLESKQLVKKRVDPADDQAIHLALTNNGRAVLTTVMQQWQDSVDQLNQSSVAQSALTLDQLLRQLLEANHRRMFGQCNSCRHLLREEAEQFRCGLTRLPLQRNETLQICVEQEYAATG